MSIINLPNNVIATPITLGDFNKDRGFNSSNEYMAYEQKGFELSLQDEGRNVWMPEAMFNQLFASHLEDSDSEEEAKSDFDSITQLYNVYGEVRRDEINSLPVEKKPEFIRVTGGGECIPDDYLSIGSTFDSVDCDIFTHLKKNKSMIY